MKRGREDKLLLVTTTEDGAFYCYTAALATFTDAHLTALHSSLPSEREGKVPGCLSPYGLKSMYDESVWTPVEQEDVPAVENVGKVVLAYAYE